MARKMKGYKGHGNGFHDSAVFKQAKRVDDLMNRAAAAQRKDMVKALANNMILVVSSDIERIGIYQMCIFCYDIELIKRKENYYKCPKCGFIKIKEGVKI